MMETLYMDDFHHAFFEQRKGQTGVILVLPEVRVFGCWVLKDKHFNRKGITFRFSNLLLVIGNRDAGSSSLIAS
jgi:hypothetical protein